MVDANGDGSLLTAAVHSVNEFAFDLHRELVERQGGNVVSSPYSVATTLGMLYGGSAGATAAEFADVLHISDEVGQDWHEGRNLLDLLLIDRTLGTDTSWSSANKVWFRPDVVVQPTFLDLLIEQYGSPAVAQTFDDEGTRLINEWVEERTAGRVEELFVPDDFGPETLMVLVNAVALDAPWEFRLSPGAARPFEGLDGVERQVPTLRFDHFLPSAATEDFVAVELPYAGGALSMIVVMPTDLPSFEASLDAVRFGEVLDSIRPGGIHLEMPRWQATTDVVLNEHLRALGVESAFGDADFSPIFGTSSGIWLDFVVHEATIEVSETGTQAAAATGAVLIESHGPTVQINRPFLYAVVDRGPGTILFLGRVADPTELVG